MTPTERSRKIETVKNIFESLIIKGCVKWVCACMFYARTTNKTEMLTKNFIFLSSEFVKHFTTKRFLAPLQINLLSTRENQSNNKKTFEDVLPVVIDCAVNNPKVAEIPGLEEWMKKMLTHNMPGGKCARGKSVAMAYEMLEAPEKITEESMKLANILGWCVEMFQSFVIIVDDIMDESTIRRGKPCWYTLPDVGNSCATNDGLMLYNCMFYVLRKHFEERTNYKDILDAINETMLYSTFGQYLDYKTAENKSKDFSHFTTDIYLTIIKYKSAYYTYDLPTKLGLILADYKVNGATMELMRNVALEIGLLFQIQDDYIDCFGDEILSGKLSSDIQEGKCTWLAVNALQRCSPAQKIVFKACYGSSEPAHIERCKQLYCDLKLPELYKHVEETYYDNIMENIGKLPTDELRKLFHRLLGITYQRKK